MEQVRRAKLSGSELRRLRELREMIKIASLTLPTPVQRKVLEILEQARPWRIPPRLLPEMSRGEVIRAIRWRLGTIPLEGATAAAEFVTRYRRLRLGPPPEARRPRRTAPPGAPR